MFLNITDVTAKFFIWYKLSIVSRIVERHLAPKSWVEPINLCFFYSDYSMLYIEITFFSNIKMYVSPASFFQDLIFQALMSFIDIIFTSLWYEWSCLDRLFCLFVHQKKLTWKFLDFIFVNDKLIVQVLLSFTNSFGIVLTYLKRTSPTDIFSLGQLFTTFWPSMFE